MKRTPTTSWSRLELASLRSVDSCAASLARETPATRTTRELPGLSWVSPEQIRFRSTMRNSKSTSINNLRLDYALSREGEKNKKGGKMYIQDKMEAYADEIFTQLDNGAHIYFCGLKGMMPGIQDMLEAVCKSKGIDYSEWLEALRHKNQWHVEVY